MKLKVTRAIYVASCILRGSQRTAPSEEDNKERKQQRCVSILLALFL